MPSTAQHTPLQINKLWGQLHTHTNTHPRNHTHLVEKVKPLGFNQKLRVNRRKKGKSQFQTDRTAQDFSAAVRNALPVG